MTNGRAQNGWPHGGRVEHLKAPGAQTQSHPLATIVLVVPGSAFDLSGGYADETTRDEVRMRSLSPS